MNPILDLRVDTLGHASPAMLQAMHEAVLGDDVMQEDETTNALEAYGAELCGKEAGLLVPSGTMANLLALLVHVPRGGEIILGQQSHIFNYEQAGASALGGISFYTVPDSSGLPEPEAVAGAIRHEDIYSARTHLLCLENTHNLAGGLACTPEELGALAAVAKAHHLPVHLDGARLLYACAAHGVEPSAYAQHLDSLMISLVKGLGAPVGALLMGSKGFINEARRLRKMLGGGMRKTGYIAAPALVALKTQRADLLTQIQRARRLATRLAALPALSVSVSERLTNILYIWLSDTSRDGREDAAFLETQGIKGFANQRGVRLVFHNGISDADIERIATTFEARFG